MAKQSQLPQVSLEFRGYGSAPSIRTQVFVLRVVHPSVQFQFPFLSNEVLAKAMMGFFLHQHESRLLDRSVRRGQHALRPQNDLAVPCRASETDAFVHQGITEAHASGAGLDKQETKLRRVRFSRMLHQKDVAHVLTIGFGDPTPFPAGSKCLIKSETMVAARASNVASHPYCSA